MKRISEGAFKPPRNIGELGGQIRLLPFDKVPQGKGEKMEKIKEELRSLLQETCEHCCLDNDDDLEHVLEMLVEYLEPLVKGDSDHDRPTPTF